MRDAEEPFVVAAFRDFYAQVIRLRRQVRANPWGAAPSAAPGPDAGDDGVSGAGARQGAAQRVSDHLLAALERQALEAGRRQGDFGAEWYREAQYVMATLADEVFLNLEWEGRGAWAANLLETRLFGSHVGGERLFARLETLLREQDAARRPIAAVYLMALSLGFQGRWRDTPGGADTLAELRRRTFAFVHPRHRSVARGERKLFPQAYAHTLEGGTPVRLPDARRWVAALALASALYLAVSHQVWSEGTRRVRAGLERVEGIEARMERAAAAAPGGAL